MCSLKGGLYASLIAWTIWLPDGWLDLWQVRNFGWLSAVWPVPRSVHELYILAMQKGWLKCVGWVKTVYEMNNNVQCLSSFNGSLSAIFSLCLLTRAKHLNMHLQVNITLAPRLHLNYGRSRCNDHAENKLICWLLLCLQEWSATQPTPCRINNAVATAALLPRQRIMHCTCQLLLFIVRQDKETNSRLR